MAWHKSDWTTIYSLFGLRLQRREHWNDGRNSFSHDCYSQWRIKTAKAMEARQGGDEDSVHDSAVGATDLPKTDPGDHNE